MNCALVPRKNIFSKGNAVNSSHRLLLLLLLPKSLEAIFAIHTLHNQNGDK